VERLLLGTADWGGVDGETTQYKVDGDGDGDVLGGNPLAVKKTL